ncbi:MAG TPA: flavin reductase family protein [Intrasporangium sp.]|nr:flavin reductase family protein [Intrasporangium sp.]
MTLSTTTAVMPEGQVPAPDAAPTHAHDLVDPAILYWGTPVVLVSTLNEDGSANLAPISSAFWLGHTATLGFGLTSHSLANLQRTGECVLNLPGPDQVSAVDRLALTTGADPVPPWKSANGYVHQRDKFAHAGVTPVRGRVVAAPLVGECPVAMEATLEAVHLTDHAVVQVTVEQVHVHPSIRMAGSDRRIDPARWRPLIMSFQRFFTLGLEVHPSRLAGIDEEAYR